MQTGKNKKSIGLLTMHRVCNYGSALQAWATQEIVKRMGYEVTIIDYVYPNKYHNQFVPKLPLWKEAARMVMNILYNHPMRRKRECFARFRGKYFNCSQTIENREDLKAVCHSFDTYLVGSDQVWNPDVLHEDYSFLLDFVPDNLTKASYASSFSQSKLKNCDINKISMLLNRFKSISVRERNAQLLVKDLIGKEVPICLDPTLLLRKEDYLPLSEESTIKIRGEYILVYVLDYAFNPYPFATRFIEELSRKKGLKVVCIDFSARQHLNISECIHLHDAIGPAEFLWLFMHATIVVTSSFHGTAFALNFEIPFFSIVNDEDTGDDRMKSLILQCGADEQMVVKGSTAPKRCLDMDWESIRKKLNMLREYSFDYLKNSLQ